MSFIVLGFFTGLSLILALGPQNIFVIEQGLKKQHIFLVCLICSMSDLLLIFLGIFLFHYFNKLFNEIILLFLNISLIIFLCYFIFLKIKEISKKKNIDFNHKREKISKYNILFKTLGFTYLNPHVYSDTVFFLGNFSKSFKIVDKIYFGIGSGLSSFVFFFLLGYLAKFFSSYLEIKKVWNYINVFIIIFMVGIIFYVFVNTLN